MTEVIYEGKRILIDESRLEETLDFCDSRFGWKGTAEEKARRDLRYAQVMAERKKAA